MISHVNIVKNHLSKIEKAYTERKAELNILTQQRDDEQKKIDSLQKLKIQEEAVLMLLTKTADEAREAGRMRMEKVVTKALQSVFGHDFRFEIELTEIGNKPAANFYVITTGENGEEIKNEPQTSRGGGINDIVAFALQVATLVVYNEPKILGPIILDEPGKHVSEEYVVKLGEFIDFINKTFKRQINMVTHQAHLAATADKTLISQMVGGKTVIKEFEADEQSEDESDAE